MFAPENSINCVIQENDNFSRPQFYHINQMLAQMISKLEFCT